MAKATTKKLKVGDAVSATEDAMHKDHALRTIMGNGGKITRIYKVGNAYIATVEVVRLVNVYLTELQTKKES